MKFVLIFLVRVYQQVISPPLHFLTGPFSGCRFFPSCSQYFIDAVTVQGPVRGACLGLWRVLRCHPWGGQGYDPPPGWEEYVAGNPGAARAGRRPCDLPENFFGHSHSCNPSRPETDADPGPDGEFAGTRAEQSGRGAEHRELSQRQSS